MIRAVVFDVGEEDLYPDVRDGLAALRRRGLRVCIAGNQTARAAALLRALHLPADAVATSGEWGVAKPRPEFFARVLELAQAGPRETVYVATTRPTTSSRRRPPGFAPA
jgi:FMN phosphatase YigB (HAD superfamily)